jgi:arylsulfatase A-like enzyme
VDFVRSAPPQQPIFLYWAPYAPHGSARPATKYKQSLKELPPLRPSYNEADVSDKPTYIRDIAPWTQTQMDDGDAFRRRQYQTLLSVDDWLGSILTALAQTGRLSNTLIVFMGDNGHPIGEHRLGASGSPQDKASPYEESINVPFIVRWDAAGWAVPRTDDHLVANVDLAETFANAAGTTEPGNEGLSLLPLIQDPGGTWRTDFLIEHGVDERFIPAYCGVRTPTLAYVQYSTGEEELYDLAGDPFELQTRPQTRPLRASCRVAHSRSRAVRARRPASPDSLREGGTSHASREHVRSSRREHDCCDVHAGRRLARRPCVVSRADTDERTGPRLVNGDTTWSGPATTRTRPC